MALARQVAERKEQAATAATLAAVEQQLEPSRLAREDTLCRESMTQAERRWLRKRRPALAQHWNLLTGLVPYPSICRMPRDLAETWRSFLTELDGLVSHDVRLHCCGGFVVTMLYGLMRTTADLDVMNRTIHIA